MSSSVASTRSADRSDWLTLVLALAVITALIAFSGGLSELVNRWSRQEEYSHGFLIPVVVAGLLWSRRKALLGSIDDPNWWGVTAVLISTAMLIVGELSAFFFLSQAGFVLALMGIVVSFGGWPLLRVAFVPLAFLVFAIPTPYLIDSELSWRLQIISSQMGVEFIRLFDIPVYLTGNIIDLGSYKLQVVEACSGLRYLYPLLSFGFLAAYMFQAPFWQRAVVFLSAVPITILMNSVRIGMVGVLVNYWGIKQAEGLLHFFEGWVIFVACAGLLAAEIWLFSRFVLRAPFSGVFRVPVAVAKLPAGSGTPKAGLVIVSLILLVVAGSADFYLAGRHEIVPSRERFASFPETFDGWTGRRSLLEPDVERTLDADDYIVSDYTKRGVGEVNFYVSYYGSQRKGSSPHSPIVCIPGGGWQITNFRREAIRSASGQELPLNRVVIERGKDKALVYYWFVQRGRNVSNEYWSKWYLFKDAIFENRTDGALVRVVTPISSDASVQVADARLRAFIDDAEPKLRGYLPGP